MTNLIQTVIDSCNEQKNIIFSKKRIVGVVFTCIGFLFVDFASTFFSKSNHVMSLEINLVIQFLIGSVVLFIISQRKENNFLKVRNNRRLANLLTQKYILTYRERYILIFIRGFVAIVGYIMFLLSTFNTRAQGVPIVFSIDGVIYFMLPWLVINRTIKLKSSVVIASIIGYTFLFMFYLIDINLLGLSKAVLGVALGVIFSCTTSIINIMTPLIVYHDPPIRVAFYQVLIGLIVALAILSFKMIFGHCCWNFPTSEILLAIYSGIFYALALPFFFSACYYTEFMLIVLLGYALHPFIHFVAWHLAL